MVPEEAVVWAGAEALRQAVGGTHQLRVAGVEALGRLAVLVHLADQQQDKTQALMGSCVAGENPAWAAALAVLDPANRGPGLGLP